MTRKPVSLLAVAQHRAGGPVKGARVVAFMVAWQTAREAMGDEWPATGVEAQALAYAAWWRESERTAWRELERFRVVFPEESTPSRIMDALRGAWDERRGVAGLGSALLPA